MTRHDEPAEGDVAGIAEWACDDYLAPLTCWTTPIPRKVPICEGCRVAFPNGAETQALYSNALAAAWDEGFDAATRRNVIGLNREHERNPYRVTERAQ